MHFFAVELMLTLPLSKLIDSWDDLCPGRFHRLTHGRRTATLPVGTRSVTRFGTGLVYARIVIGAEIVTSGRARQCATMNDKRPFSALRTPHGIRNRRAGG